MPFFIVAQAIGICAMLLLFLSYQCKDNHRLFLLQSGTNLLFAIHFLMLGAYTGMLMNIISMARCLALSSRSRRIADSKLAMWCFIAVSAAVGCIGFSFPISLFSITAVIVSMFAMWSNNGKTIRLAQLCAISPLWLVYNIFAGSQPSLAGIANEIICMTSVAVSIKRFGLKRLGAAEN